MARAVLVISYDQPEDVDAGFQKLSGIADRVRGIFADEHDVKVQIAVRESADAVLNVFEVGE